MFVGFTVVFCVCDLLVFVCVYVVPSVLFVCLDILLRMIYFVGFDVNDIKW